MSSKNRKEEQLVDMSARKKLKIAIANQNEIEQNQKFFEKLNNDIDNSIKTSSNCLNTYIVDLQKKRKYNWESYKFCCDKLYGLEWLFSKYIIVALLFCLLVVSILVISFSIVRNTETVAMAQGWVFEYDNNLDQSYTIEDEIKLQPQQSVTPVQKIKLSPNFTQMIPISYGYTENENHNELLKLKKENVAQDTVTGEQLSLEQLSGKRFLISYKEQDKEVYFLGQYSKNCKWDGYCVTNTYNSDGTLYGICEYTFDDGVSLECKSIYNSTTDGEWIYVDREYEGDEGYGESVRYSFIYKECKKFKETDVEVADILYVDKFLEGIDAVKLSYYKGKMSNGSYNDKSGEAYLITFFEPYSIENVKAPVIKTLYKGKFVDGKFFEEDYNSWYITRNVDTTYMYYKGCFLNGSAQHKDETREVFVNKLTHEQIDEYLDEYGLSEYSDQFVTEYESIADK